MHPVLVLGGYGFFGQRIPLHLPGRVGSSLGWRAGPRAGESRYKQDGPVS